MSVLAFAASVVLKALSLIWIGLITPSWLGVPMMVGEKVLGVIAVVDLEQEYAYDEQDLVMYTEPLSVDELLR